jgi:hypothetical protein
MPDITQQFAERGDLAHLALFLWASGASGLFGLGAEGAGAFQQAVQRFCQRDFAAEPLFRDHS